MTTPKTFLTAAAALAALTATAQIITPDRQKDAPGDSEPLYGETYRPRYHYTPAKRWIGDPSGLVTVGGKHLAYCWGAAESEDLVHWTELNHHAIEGIPEGISAFTGSVAVDSAGTAGYGPGAMIAAFTSFDRETKKQSQSIAFSRDGGKTFQYYDQNPVLDLWSTEFRDPTVIRDPKTGKWVMVVAKALNKKVGIYTSDDLKTWTWASDFGPMGDNEKSWECPDLFTVPVDGDPNNRKWVLLVSVNWAREQYFTGDFNGKEFIPDTPNAMPLYVDEGLDYYASRVFQNYDDPNAPVRTIGWVNTWDYANTAPSKWGKGIWSVPREYTLRTTPEGLRLFQQPAEELKSLRGTPFKLSKTMKPGRTPLPKVSAMGNTYELEVEFDSPSLEPYGLDLCEGSGRKLAVWFDPRTRNLSIDRRNTSAQPIEKFDRTASCRVPGAGGKLRLQVFVDKSTVEIFVNGGERTLSMLTFAGNGQDSASLTALGSDMRVNLTAWPLASIWKQEAKQRD